MNFFTRIFRHRTFEEIIQELSEKIILCGLEYRASIQGFSNQASADAGAEVIYLLLHEIDRMAFDVFDAVPKQHEKVMKLLTNKTTADYAHAVLKKDIQTYQVSSFGLKMVENFNNRHIEIYSHCKTLVEKSGPVVGTRIFALGYFIHRVLSKTQDKNNVRDILIGRRKLTREDYPFFPSFVGVLVKLQVYIVSSLIPMKIKENLQELLTAK